MRQELPPGDTFLLVSKDSYFHGTMDGAISEVGREKAAQMIAKQTHRLATTEEGMAYVREKRTKLREREAELEKAKAPAVVYLKDLPLPPGTTPALANEIANATAAPPANAGGQEGKQNTPRERGPRPTPAGDNKADGKAADGAGE